MTTNTYFIIGGIAVIFIVYLFFMKSLANKNNKKRLDDFNSNNSGAELTEEQKRLLAFGGILFYYRGEKILGNKPENNITQYVSVLSQEWGITNAAEAKETLNDLLSLETSNSYGPILAEESKDLHAIQKDIAKGLGIDKSVVEQVKSAYAWDVCRAVSIAKWCNWIGYLTEDETWSIMQKASEIAASKGENWDSYTISFLLGRTIQGFDLDDLIVETKQLFTGKGPALRKIEGTDIYTKYKFK